jgi:Ni/Co efflux regulator RcnB
MKSRTIAIVGSIAAMSFVAAPIAQAASSAHHPATTPARIDRSLDARDARHVDKTPEKTTDRSRDKTPEKTSVDRSRDTRDH